jgi:hypothetical protein
LLEYPTRTDLCSSRWPVGVPRRAPGFPAPGPHSLGAITNACQRRFAMRQERAPGFGQEHSTTNASI